jgi:hypothetical protein
MKVAEVLGEPLRMEDVIRVTELVRQFMEQVEVHPQRPRSVLRWPGDDRFRWLVVKPPKLALKLSDFRIERCMKASILNRFPHPPEQGVSDTPRRPDISTTAIGLVQSLLAWDGPNSLADSSSHAGELTDGNDKHSLNDRDGARCEIVNQRPYLDQARQMDKAWRVEATDIHHQSRSRVRNLLPISDRLHPGCFRTLVAGVFQPFAVCEWDAHHREKSSPWILSR